MININGTIKDRTIKKGVSSQGKVKEQLKVYDVFYRYKDPATGKLKQTSRKGFRTKKEAEDFLLKVNLDISNSSFIQPNTLSLGEYLLEWLETYVETNLRETTIAGYRRNVEKHIIPYIGGIKLQDLTVGHIDNLYVTLYKSGRSDGKGGLSAKSIRYVHRVLYEALDHAGRKKLITFNVAKEVTTLPKLKKYKAEIYDKNEILHLLKTVEDTEMEMPIILAALCGLRRGEVLGLRWRDVSFENRVIRINEQLLPTKEGLKLSPTKSEESNREVSLPNFVLSVLEKQYKKQSEYKKLLGDEYIDKDLVVCRVDGSFISPSSLSKSFSRLLGKHKLKHIRFHDLRHSAASFMLAIGINLKQVSETLGHSSIAITADLYGHVTTESKKEAARRIDQSLLETEKNDQ